MTGTRRRVRIDLALQGGGAHGAFTWGVLDRLLAEERIEIDAISGTSAGAMNAVVLADGLAAGARRGAREALREFWGSVSRAASMHGGAAALFGDAAIAGSPLQWTMDWMTRFFSPQQFNPLDINPLRDALAASVDFERVRAQAVPRLFVSATHAATGRLREFRHHEITLDAVMASACLPMLFRAVTIEGEAYWDGGYVGNPSLLPLIADSPAHDLLLVQINPTRREHVPASAQAIVGRINEITFNASLVKELRSVALLKQALAGAVKSDAPQASAVRADRGLAAALHRRRPGAAVAGRCQQDAGRLALRLALAPAGCRRGRPVAGSTRHAPWSAIDAAAGRARMNARKRR